MSRQTISAAQLHALLEQAFQRTRNVDCVTRCRMPEPVFREPAGDAPNWYVPPPPKCPRHCHRLILEAVTDLGALYDLKRPS
jgi:hypothetical protein